MADILFTDADIIAILREHLRKFNRMQEAADSLCVGVSTLDYAVNQRRPISPCILQALGYERVVLYKKCKNVSDFSH
jgi:hypothetical protein